MTQAVDIDAYHLIPADIIFPDAITPRDRQEICESLNRTIAGIGIAHQLQTSIGTNIAEFTATLISMIEKVRSDLQPAFLTMVDKLTQSTEEAQISLLSKYGSSFAELVCELQELRGTIKALEKREEHKDPTDCPVQHTSRILENTEKIAKLFIDRILQNPYASDSDREALIEKLECKATENGQLRKAIRDAYHQAQQISWTNAKIKEQILKILGDHIYE